MPDSKQTTQPYQAKEIAKEVTSIAPVLETQQAEENKQFSSLANKGADLQSKIVDALLDSTQIRQLIEELMETFKEMKQDISNLSEVKASLPQQIAEVPSSNQQITQEDAEEIAANPTIGRLE